MGELLRRSLFPIIRVFSLLFVLYMAAFWTLGQVRYGLTGGGFRMGRRRGDAAGPGAGTSKQDLMALYGVSDAFSWTCFLGGVLVMMLG